IQRPICARTLSGPRFPTRFTRLCRRFVLALPVPAPRPRIAARPATAPGGDRTFLSGAWVWQADRVVTLNPVRRAPGGYFGPLAPNGQRLGQLCRCRQAVAPESESNTKCCGML